MTDRPMLFSGPMVRALLDGRTERRKLYAKAGQDPKTPAHLAKRLANGLDAAPDGACWNWKRTRNNQGYGTLTVDGKAAFAHRLAYQLSHGPIPPGCHVLHKCDNAGCINPDHLEAGTQSKNMADCHARGRSKIPVIRMPGETNGSAKLTERQVAEIKGRVNAGHVQQRIADDYGVSQTLISAIKRNLLWPSVVALTLDVHKRNIDAMRNYPE